MQTKITFAGGSISSGTFNHENMHQWWGDNVSEGSFNMTFFKEGFAHARRVPQQRARTRGSGRQRHPGWRRAFETSLVSQFNTNYARPRPAWTDAPSNPTRRQLFSTAYTYTPARHRVPRAAPDPRRDRLQHGAPGDPDDLRRQEHHRAPARGRLPQVPAEPERGVLDASSTVLHAVVRHRLPGGRRRQQAADHGPRPEPAPASTTPTGGCSSAHRPGDDRDGLPRRGRRLVLGPVGDAERHRRGRAGRGHVLHLGRRAPFAAYTGRRSRSPVTARTPSASTRSTRPATRSRRGR